MRKFALRLVLLFAAMMAGVWPALAGQGRHDMMQAAMRSMADHGADHGAMHHGGDHAVGTDRAEAGGCAGQSDAGAAGGCMSGLLACGFTVAGTAPYAFEEPSRVQVRLPAWRAPEELLTARAVSPDLRPPRLPS